MENKIVKISNETDLKQFLAKNYMAQIKNFFEGEKQALKFLSSVMASVQKIPDLLKCEPMSVVNSFMTMAQLGFMPSSVSGEAYVLPYNGIAQFQLGYKGIVTLLYGAGAKSVVSEQVREKDVFTLINGSIHHEVNPLKTRVERGEVIGAYAIINLQTGGKVEKFMRQDEILAHAKQFSKSFSSKFSPWNAVNDPEGWMPRKTVLKQASKLAPKNEKLLQAIDEDNKDSRISEIKKQGLVESSNLQMGKFLNTHDKNSKAEGEEEIQIGVTDSGAEGEDQ